MRSSTGCLDTLQTSDDIFKSKCHESLIRLHNRRSRKALTVRMAKGLCSSSKMRLADRDGDDLEAKQLRGYIKMHECNRIIFRDGNKVTSNRYCNHRGCLVCNSIKSAKMRNAYASQIESMQEPYFITLTKPNVKGDDLKDELKSFSDDWRKIAQSITTYNRRNPHNAYSWNGIRAIECTYNWKLDNYNPHIHIIVESKRTAEKILKAHLKHNPHADANGQDIKKADSKAITELFKYVAKGISGSKYSADVQHIIYDAFRYKNAYYPFGGIKKLVEEDVSDRRTEEVKFDDGGDSVVGVYVWNESYQRFGGWCESDNQSLLGDWRTDKKTRKYQRMCSVIDKALPDLEAKRDDVDAQKDFDEMNRHSLITDDAIAENRANYYCCISNEIDLF